MHDDGTGNANVGYGSYALNANTAGRNNRSAAIWVVDKFKGLL